MQWLYQARKRYGLKILNYIVTSNHIHLLVMDTEGLDSIPRSIQLVAGRTGQEYNQRKRRKGAFWEDRYHAVAIESGEHLIRCLVYIDLNMVRAGVVDHPSEWEFSGYNEIQRPRRKCILISYNTLMKLTSHTDYESFRESHHKWIQVEVEKTDCRRKTHWTESIAVGGKRFVKEVKARLAPKAIGRKIRSLGHGMELRETIAPYNAFFGPEKDDIGFEYRPF